LRCDFCARLHGAFRRRAGRERGYLAELPVVGVASVVQAHPPRLRAAEGAREEHVAARRNRLESAVKAARNVDHQRRSNRGPPTARTSLLAGRPADARSLGAGAVTTSNATPRNTSARGNRSGPSRVTSPRVAAPASRPSAHAEESRCITGCIRRGSPMCKPPPRLLGACGDEPADDRGVCARPG
jgi:hypothetical protein